MLPPNDEKILAERAPGYSVVQDGGMICVQIPALVMPPKLTVASADLLLRLSPGYPDVPPDMWWFSPAVRREDGRLIPATEVEEHYFGRLWQRWSRHLSGGQWRSGVDSLESYLALVHSELRTAARALAA
jgi:hypothetical protein